MIDPRHHLTEDQLQALLDGDLDPGSTLQAQSHLAACPACQGQLARLERVLLQLEKLPGLGLSRDLSGPVLSRLRQERQLSPGITWTIVIEALAAGLALGLLIPVFMAAGWLPRLLGTPGDLLAAVNIYLTQLASSWLVWWAEIKLQAGLLGENLLSTPTQPLVPFSPWILIGAAGGLGLIVNYFLLGRRPLPSQNQHNH